MAKQNKKFPMFKVVLSFVPQEIIVINAKTESEAQSIALGRYAVSNAKIPTKNVKVTEVK